MLNRSVVVICSFIIWCTLDPAAAAQSKDTEIISQQVSEFVHAYHNAGIFSGTVLIASGDEIVFAEGVGYANTEMDHLNKVDTVFKTCSIGKQFYAALALRLSERGELDIHAPIAKYLPEYPRPQGDDITIHMLMNQTSGIPNFTRLPMYRDARNVAVEPNEFYKKFSGLELEFEPGTEWAYSNSGYYVLGIILERVSGLPIHELLETELFSPLELTQTGYDSDPVMPVGRALGYEWSPTGMQPEQLVHPSKIFSAGMIYSSASDLFRWTRQLHANAPFIQRGTHLLMTDPGEGKTENYVYGLDIWQYERGGAKYRTVGHEGGQFGFQALLEYITPGDWTLVVLCNSGQDIEDLTEGLKNIIAGIEPVQPRPPLMNALAESIEQHGLSRTKQWVAAITEGGAKDYFVDEFEINNLGYNYLLKEQIDKSILVFHVNTKLFPESANVFDSLGEAYLAQGNQKLAFDNYKRALDMDPGNTHAISVIRQIENDRIGQKIVDEAND